MIDHFACYRLRGARFKTSGLAVQDQLGSYVVDLKKPFRVCVAVDKNDEGIVDPAAALLCYKARNVPNRPPYAGPISIDNQFGAMTLGLTRTREFCVPSVVTGP